MGAYFFLFTFPNIANPYMDVKGYEKKISGIIWPSSELK